MCLLSDKTGRVPGAGGKPVIGPAAARARDPHRLPEQVAHGGGQPARAGAARAGGARERAARAARPEDGGGEFAVPAGEAGAHQAAARGQLALPHLILRCFHERVLIVCIAETSARGGPV